MGSESSPNLRSFRNITRPTAADQADSWTGGLLWALVATCRSTTVAAPRRGGSAPLDTVVDFRALSDRQAARMAAPRSRP